MPYGLWKGRSANVKHFRIFGSECYIKREGRKGGKFDFRVDECIFIGYSWKRKEYRCYNLRLIRIVESINVTFDKNSPLKTKRENKKLDIPNGEMNIKQRK